MTIWLDKRTIWVNAEHVHKAVSELLSLVSLPNFSEPEVNRKAAVKKLWAWLREIEVEIRENSDPNRWPHHADGYRSTND